MRRKYLLFLILGVIFVNVAAVSAFASEAPTVTVEKVVGKTGETVEIPVVLENNSGFSNISIEIDYDSTALELTAVKSESTGAVYVGAPDYTVKPYNMSWTSAGKVTYNGMLATLSFKILAETNGEYSVTVDYYKGINGNYTDGNNVNYDENFAPLGLEYADGSVTVKNSSGSMTVSSSSFAAVTFDGEPSAGTVYAALYDSHGKLTNLKKYPAAETVNVVFDSGVSGDYVKIMWWKDNLNPVCEEKRIPLS